MWDVRGARLGTRVGGDDSPKWASWSKSRKGKTLALESCWLVSKAQRNLWNIICAEVTSCANRKVLIFPSKYSSPMVKELWLWLKPSPDPTQLMSRWIHPRQLYTMMVWQKKDKLSSGGKYYLTFIYFWSLSFYNNVQDKIQKPMVCEETERKWDWGLEKKDPMEACRDGLDGGIIQQGP